MGLQDYYNTGRDDNTTVYDVNWRAMTFVAGASYDISAIKLELLRKGSGGGDLEVAIRATSGGVPTGADLTSGSILANSVVVDSWGWHGINVTEYGLTEGVRYAIIVRTTSGDGANNIRWGYNNGGAYDGQLCASSDSGATWPLSYAFRDCMFEIYEDVYFYAEGTLVVQGDCLVVLSHETSTATGILITQVACSALLSYEVCIADEGALIAQGIGSVVLSHEVTDTIEWPFERPEIDPDLHWDEETQTWITAIVGPGRYKQRVIAVGLGDANEGTIYFGDM